MTKYIHAKMSNGETYRIPADVVARSMGAYYGRRNWESGYREGANPVDQIEIEALRALRDDDELIDWAANNMNWEDVAAVATLVESAPSIDLDSEWTNAWMTVVEVAS